MKDKYYFMTDNRMDIYGGWYAEYNTRKEAFKGAVGYLEMRLVSGIPTRSPYVLKIRELYKNDFKKRGRVWEVRLEIENVTAKQRQCHCFRKEEYCTCNKIDQKEAES
jgi:hypothetical protein